MSAESLRPISPRAVLLMAAWLVVPPLVGIAAIAADASTLGLSVYLPWKVWVYPHDAAVIREGYRARRAWSAGMALLLACAQWATALAAFGRYSRRLSAGWQAVLAPIAVVSVGWLAQLGFGAAGVSFELDGP
jgi:hypothetical protein